MRLWGGGLYGCPKRSFYMGSSFKGPLKLDATGVANHAQKLGALPPGRLLGSEPTQALASVARRMGFLLVSALADRQPEPGVMQGGDSDAVKFERVWAIARELLFSTVKEKELALASECCSS